MAVMAKFILFCVGCVALWHALSHWVRSRGKRRGPEDGPEDAFSGLGYSVEMDCRGCGKVNRVPGHRLRDCAKCGCCKARLMPLRKIVVCRVSVMDGSLRSDLDAVWNDEERLWQRLADHMMLDAKKKVEERSPGPRVVN